MTKVNFDEINAALKAEEWRTAIILLRNTVRSEHPYTVQARAAKLFRNIPAGAIELRPIKIAIVASSTIEHLADILPYWMATTGFAAEIYLTPFDTMVQAVLDDESELYAFKPDVVWLFGSFRDVRLNISAGADMTAVQVAVAQAVEEHVALWEKLLANLNCIILHNNADMPLDDPFGNLAGVFPWGSRSAYRLFNFALGTAVKPGVTIYDLDHIASLYGKRQWFDSRFWFHSKHAFALDAIGLVASSAARLITAAKGMARKALVLDLDNTLWGGVIGDDGVDGIRLGMKADGEAFVAFQSYLHALKDRGIILTVCSKNDEANAKEPFDKHPDMRLRLSDIAVFAANWEVKVDNIRNIAATLNIGLDSLVFVDDNPAERDIVRRYLPMVEVPELPEDPSGYIEALASGRYFETLSFSDEDRERARHYRENAMRAELQSKFKDTAEYLRSLQMTAEVGTLDSFHLPRMSQLINKSNQFHLTGTRYSEADLLGLAAKPGYAIRYFKLRDRFGDNGLVSVAVLRAIEGELHIDTWVMSCRVLGRSMEEFIYIDMLHIAREHGCHSLIGYYKPSTKNRMVSGLYEKLGFEMVYEDKAGFTWRRAVNTGLKELQTYVNHSAIAAQ